jgi:hypothetical protein
MAGRPDVAESQYIHGAGPEPKYADLLQALKVGLDAANAVNDGSMEARARVALLQERFWNQQSLVSMDCGYFDDATKASREATRHGELAVKFSKATLADRVHKLEQALADGKRKGSRIVAEAKARKKVKT